jgi:DNA (cytosine-5)-methyltransferase 1
MSQAFYNEHDAYPAQWMRNLIDAGQIAPGTVDERSVTDLDPAELAGFSQCHFFAGIGVWSYALRLAGWDDARSVWTGSCPCQPFSVAGQRRGTDDDRHLWPAWFRLIRECRPATVFGEQVGGAAGGAWLDAVCADLEAVGYAVGAAVLPAAGVGAPHMRHRIFFVAHDDRAGRDRLATPRVHERREASSSGEPAAGRVDGPSGHDADRCGAAGELADATHTDGRPGERGAQAGVGTDGERWRGSGGGRDAGEPRLEGHAGQEHDRHEPGRHGTRAAGSTPAASAHGGAWSDARWVWCRDNRWRPHGAESFPLSVAHGTAARVGRLRAYGNAIVPQVAAEFIAAYLDVKEDART